MCLVHIAAERLTDYTHFVSGAILPDATGGYVLNGTYGGKSCYKLYDQQWYIWWLIPTDWIISEVLGTEGARYWRRVSSAIVGDYLPMGTATGTATVAVAP